MASSDDSDFEPQNATIDPLPSRTYGSIDGIPRYTLRSLAKDESEIDKWSEFCASVFADKKPTPPTAEYFRRHYYNDPNRDASLIRVATVRRPAAKRTIDGKLCDESTEEEIVASCRVFLRRIHVMVPVEDEYDHDYDSDDDGPNDPLRVDVGGIGEVCTSPRHRRMGLSRALLQDCFEMMKARYLSLSMLHAAPTFFPVYEGAGYRRTTTSWTIVPYTYSSSTAHNNPSPGAAPAAAASSTTGYPSSTTTTSPTGFYIRPASFPEDRDQISNLYSQLYSYVSGCMVREFSYWDDYLAQEWKDRMWVAVGKPDVDKEASSGCGIDDPIIIGWIVARLRDCTRTTSDGTTETCRRVQICDFGAASNTDPKFPATYAGDVDTVLNALVGKAIEELCLKDDRSAPQVPAASHMFDVMMPTLVATLFSSTTRESSFDWSRSHVEIDEGWMYKALEVEDDYEKTQFAKEVLERLRTDPLHVVWPADSF